MSYSSENGDDLADIDEQYAASERAAKLLEKIVDLLHTEATEEDPVMGGSISLENINYALRKEISPRPSQALVEDCLLFLTHDLVRGAARHDKRYKLADAPINIMRRLHGLGLGLTSIGLTDEPVAIHSERGGGPV